MPRPLGIHLFTIVTCQGLLTRPLTLKRINVFTLNYDTLVEQAADAEGAVLLDGFVGTMRRVFRPESMTTIYTSPLRPQRVVSIG